MSGLTRKIVAARSVRRARLLAEKVVTPDVRVELRALDNRIASIESQLRAISAEHREREVADAGRAAQLEASSNLLDSLPAALRELGRKVAALESERTDQP